MREVNREKLDRDQRRAVFSDRNTVVSAGAGSGKTKVLAERFHRLVAEGKAQVDQILTLTFTRKAAAEMHRRIYDLLRIRRDNDFVRRAVDGFGSARISTLDSFSASILRGTAPSYGIPPNFTLDDEGAREQAQRLSLTFILENQERPSLAYLVRNNGLASVVQNFAALATDRLPVGKDLGFPAMGKKQGEHLSIRLCQEVGELDKLVADILGIPLSPEKGGGQAQTVRTGQEALADWTGLASGLETPEGMGRLLAALEVLVSLRKPGGRVGDPDIQAYKDLLDSAREREKKISIILRTLEHQPLMRDLFSLLEDFHRRSDNVKRGSGILSFGDCAELAVRSLTEHRDLRSHYKKAFRYIMIDEFQDNNLLQKELLYLLAEREDLSSPGIPAATELTPEKLFFVGDEKQSIYRFRGADVRVFKGLGEELFHCGGESLRLDTNYRSAPGLVEFFNRLFSRVMEGAEADHEARFEELSPRPSQEGQPAPESPLISLFCKPYQETPPQGVLDNDSAEAYFLARTIRDWVRNGDLPIQNGKTGLVRPAEYGDFAVLMRSTSGQMTYERMFRLFGVPYTTAGIRSLFLEAPVNDLYAALQTAVYPEDRVAYTALLRSPLVGLSDDLLVQILLRNLPPFDSGDLALPPEEEEKLRRGRELYLWIRAGADSLSVPALLSYLWHEGGYRFFVLRDPVLHPFLELYDYLREFALLVPGEGLAAFLDRLRPNLGNYERIPELEIQRDDTDGVKIMTVHRAKGLEFPVVVLANAGNVGRRDGAADRIFHWSEELGLSCTLGGRGEKCNFFHADEKELEDAREDGERKRLLYVACTRAENHLVISGRFTRNNRSSDKAFLTMIFRALGLDPDNPDPASSSWDLRIIPDVPEENLYREGVRMSPPSLDAAAEAYSREPLIRRATRREYAVTELAALLRRTGPEVSGLPMPSGDEVSPDTPTAEESSPELDAWFGSLCHRVLELLLSARKSQDQLGGPLNQEDKEALRTAAPLRGDSPRPEGYGDYLEKALELAEAFFRSSFMEELFAAASKDGVKPETEVPFTARPWADGPRVNGIIDLVFPLSGETLVVDFKTDRREVPELHSLQMAVYREAAEAIWGRPAKAWLYYLRSGRAVLCGDPLPPLKGESLE